MILITSASGMTGLAAVRALARRGFGPKITGMARSQASIAAILRAGASNFISGDLRDTESISRSMRSIETVFHICPRMQPDEVEIGGAVIAAAEKAGVARFVLHSVISSQIDDIVFHAAKRAVELSLIKSKLAFTILQPNSYMQNLSWSWSDILQHSQFVMPLEEGNRRPTPAPMSQTYVSAIHILRAVHLFQQKAIIAAEHLPPA